MKYIEMIMMLNPILKMVRYLYNRVNCVKFVNYIRI